MSSDLDVTHNQPIADTITSDEQSRINGGESLLDSSQEEVTQQQDNEVNGQQHDVVNGHNDAVNDPGIFLLF